MNRKNRNRDNFICKWAVVMYDNLYILDGVLLKVCKVRICRFKLRQNPSNNISPTINWHRCQCLGLYRKLVPGSSLAIWQHLLSPSTITHCRPFSPHAVLLQTPLESFRTSPIDALEVIPNIKPIDIQVKDTAVLSALRLYCTGTLVKKS